MKNSLKILIAINLLLATTTYAQDSNNSSDRSPEYHVMEFGFRFMPTFSSFDISTTSGGVVKSEVTLGYGGGIFLGYNINKHIGIQTEIIYNSLSQKYKDADLSKEVNVRYINIPLLFSLNTGVGNVVNLRVVFGPQLGLNVGSSIKTPGGDSLVTVFSTKKSDVGIAYGAGLGFTLNDSRTVRLDLGYRGVYGLVNISGDSNSNTTNSNYILDRAKIRTNSAYVGITFLFGNSK